ncbi:NHL repeat-containing protein [Saccharopolyspora gregorii]|uniref:hypothetical protein n=1 Tax=Saccharopolyspora gregorii TaxID=33914 RepID=UPI0021ACF55A|nr:hypothetical protein [Saccharopolyspora gregorii]
MSGLRRRRRAPARSVRRGSALAAVVVLCGLGTGAPGAAAAPELPAPVQRCRVTDPGLTELSGLASDGRYWYAVDDGGSSLRVALLDRDSCEVGAEWTSPTDPYDVEDLALAPDGAAWLADTGDNRRARSTVALHRLTADGDSQLYRLSYPDGPHDAEALLLDRAGTPHVVTKEPFGMAFVYRPAEPLVAGGTVPWERVGELALPTTDSPDGPIKGIGTRLVTGGSVSRDGTLIALRTYTEAYLFHAPDGDVPAALRRPPVALRLPSEPQGEAIAWDPDGSLVTSSEGLQPVYVLPGAASLLATGAEPDPSTAPGTPAPGVSEPAEGEQPAPEPDDAADGSVLSTAPALVVAGGLAALLLYFLVRMRRR